MTRALFATQNNGAPRCRLVSGVAVTAPPIDPPTVAVHGTATPTLVARAT